MKKFFHECVLINLLQVYSVCSFKIGYLIKSAHLSVINVNPSSRLKVFLSYLRPEQRYEIHQGHKVW